jgi:hypothetical protein
MGARTENQEEAFKFLKRKFETMETFTKEEFQSAAGFNEGTFETYLAKQFKGLLKPVEPNRFRVSGVFRLFRTWKQFRDKVVTQNRNWGRTYKHIEFNNVVIFEFYMPLRNEEFLRETLDALFFKDAVVLRLKAIKDQEILNSFPREPDESTENYIERICRFVSDKFGGYSIVHVSGRFRADSLKPRAEVFGGNAIAPNRYIVDETTAVVRFIIPCNENSPQNPLGPEIAETEANVIRVFFKRLFVESILEVVNAEDEIWLLESGMRSRLHIWRAGD